MIDDGIEVLLLEELAYQQWAMALKASPLPPNATRGELEQMGAISTRAMIRACKATYGANAAEAIVAGVKLGLVPREN